MRDDFRAHLRHVRHRAAPSSRTSSNGLQGALAPRSCAGRSFPISPRICTNRHGRHFMFWETLRSDIRHTLRLAVKTPVFTDADRPRARARHRRHHRDLRRRQRRAAAVAALSRRRAAGEHLELQHQGEPAAQSALAGQLPRLPEDEHDARRARGLLHLRHAGADADRRRHRGHLLAVRDAEHVQHARPLRRARPRVRARRRQRRDRAERRLLAPPLRRRSEHRRQDADAERRSRSR